MTTKAMPVMTLPAAKPRCQGRRALLCPFWRFVRLRQAGHLRIATAFEADGAPKPPADRSDPRRLP